MQEVEAVNCRKLLSDPKSRYGSYYTAQFAFFLAYFSDAVSTVCRIEKRSFIFIGQTECSRHVKWNFFTYGRKNAVPFRFTDGHLN